MAGIERAGGHTTVARKTGLLLGALAVAASVLVADVPADAAFPGINGRVYCASNRDGNNEIYAFDPEGLAAPIRITNNPALDFDPTLRSDGRRMAFSSNRDANNEEVYVQNADGSGP
ncbi:MAG: hypothetical protein M3144_11540, partial [Actinomycetota bacterium]|nr:hypothetical protein [Actinomycetota bacterium]